MEKAVFGTRQSNPSPSGIPNPDTRPWAGELQTGTRSLPTSPPPGSDRGVSVFSLCRTRPGEQAERAGCREHPVRHQQVSRPPHSRVLKTPDPSPGSRADPGASGWNSNSSGRKGPASQEATPLPTRLGNQSGTISCKTVLWRKKGPGTNGCSSSGFGALDCSSHLLSPRRRVTWRPGLGETWRPQPEPCLTQA